MVVECLVLAPVYFSPLIHTKRVIPSGVGYSVLSSFLQRSTPYAINRKWIPTSKGPKVPWINGRGQGVKTKCRRSLPSAFYHQINVIQKRDKQRDEPKANELSIEPRTAVNSVKREILRSPYGTKDHTNTSHQHALQQLTGQSRPVLCALIRHAPPIKHDTTWTSKQRTGALICHAPPANQAHNLSMTDLYVVAAKPISHIYTYPSAISIMLWQPYPSATPRSVLLNGVCNH